jgi:hypothetical protein
MALTKTISLQNNFCRESTFENAYIKIVSISGNKNSLTAEVAIFDSKDGMFLKSQSLSFVPDLDGANFIRQAYTSAKKTKEFENATDC